MKHFILSVIILGSLISCKGPVTTPSSTGQTSFSLALNTVGDQVSIFHTNGDLILTQNAAAHHRPYLHPIISPDGVSVMTEYSPGHHKHQTGIYWGMTRVNQRDFFHNPGEGYWQRVDLLILQDTGQVLRWSTTYEMLDSLGEVLLTETQVWSFREKESRYLLDLEWQGQAAQEIIIGAYDYGGLFIRMPWTKQVPSSVINAARDRDQRAEGKRAMWIDLGMHLEGRDDMARISVFDHPQNGGYPTPWRVDGQFGVGPARCRLGDWKIPKGHTEIMKYRLEVYTGEASDIELTKRWQDYTGNDGMYSTASLWGIAQNEGREADLLSPSEAVAAMTIKDGYEVNVWAAEPDITQPMAFCWDHRGRLWIAENRDYESRGSGFSSYGDSRILILEDTNLDGRADTRKVFLEGIAFPAAIAVGFNGLFLGAPPHLLFVPDKDGDDRADMADIEIRLTGWGIRDRHETLNSLHWGPDGWLYGCQGFATPSKVRKPQGPARLFRQGDPFPADLLQGDGIDINGGVWRYHPTKDRFEVVAHGFSNPWGIDYDQHGQLFISACVIPHLWHVIPGGIYHRQGGQHFNPYVYQDIRTIADHRHRSAHGGARIYLSDAFPEDQFGRLFMANIHEHAVLTDILKRKGSGFVAHHGEDFLLANNAQWIGFSMEVGPDGGVYVLDWHDADICGKEVVNKETGRIFRLMPRQSQAKNWEGRYANLTLLDDLTLAGLQTSRSSWHARRARIILQERAFHGGISAPSIAKLRSILSTARSTEHRLNALWALHVSNALAPDRLPNLLSDDDEYIRAWAIQLLCEDFSPNEAATKSFLAMAKLDPSPVVRLYLASAIQRLKTPAKWKLASELVARVKDQNDQNIPYMIWYGIEPIIIENHQKALTLVAKSKLSTINQFVTRRLVDGGKIDLVVGSLKQPHINQSDILKGMLAAMEGRTDVEMPHNWRGTFSQLQKESKELRDLSNQVNQMFGDQEVIRKWLADLVDVNVNTDDKIHAIRQLALRAQPELADQIPNLLPNEVLQNEVIKAIAQYDRSSLGKLLLSKFNEFNQTNKDQALQTLSSRPGYGWLLTQALTDGVVERKEVPTYMARQLRRVVGSGFVEVWGPIDEPEADIAQAYNHYRDLMQKVAVEDINMQNGKLLFLRTCGPCHKMYGEGGNLGPDITGSNRTSLEYLLGNILEPSREMQDDYRMTVVTTRSGRTYSGNKIAETSRQITMRLVGQEDIILNKSEIQSQEIAPLSMMPQGLLRSMTDQEVIDLLGYLIRVESI